MKTFTRGSSMAQFGYLCMVQSGGMEANLGKVIEVSEVGGLRHH